MNQSLGRGLSALLLAILLALALTSRRDDEEARPIGNEATFGLPGAVELERLEPAVRDRIRQAVANLDRLVATHASAKTVGTSLGELGMLLHAHSFHNAAQEYYLGAHARLPQEFRWPYYLGHLYQQMGNVRQSERFLQRALEIDSEYLPAYVALAMIYQSTNRLDQSESLLERAQRLRRDHAPVLLALGRVAYSRGEYHQAVEYLEQARRLAPEATEINYPLGMAYRGLGRLETARSFLAARGTVSIAASDPLMARLQDLETGYAVHQNRGNVAFMQGRYREAANAFRQAIAAEPDNAQIRANLAASLSRLSDDAGAMEQTLYALRLDPDNALANFGMGTLLARRGEDDEAIRYYRRSIGADGGMFGAHYNLANALYRSGHSAQALQHFHRAVEIDPGSGPARYGVAVTLISLERWSDAAKELETSYMAMPDAQPIAIALARLLAACPDDGLRDGDRALKIAVNAHQSQSSVNSAEAVAMALAELGRYSEAVRYQEAAIEAARNAGRPDIELKLLENLEFFRNARPTRNPN